MSIEKQKRIAVAWDNSGFVHPNFVAMQMESRASDWNKEFKNKAVRVKILASCFPHFTGRQLLDISEGLYEFTWEEGDGQYNMAFTLKDGEEE